MNCIEEKYSSLALNAIFFDERAPFEKQIPVSIKTHGMWYYIIRILYAVIKETTKIIIKFPFKQWLWGYEKYAPYYQGDVIFHAITTNNLRSIEGVKSAVMKTKTNVTVLDNSNYYRCFPRLLLLIKSISAVPSLFNQLQSLTPRNRRIAGYYISYFFLAYGFTHCCYKLLSKYRPESVIFANDHIYNRKALALICEDLGIKTIYVQHASVSYAFPELHFSFNFLDGLDAFDKYTADGKHVYGQAILLGALRFDRLSVYRERRDTHLRNCLGIAVNRLDDYAIVSEICDGLLSKYPNISLRIRLHPSIKGNPLDIKETCRYMVTNAKDENIVDYFDNIDVQISGDSSVHFDALLGGVPTLAFNFTSLPYGDNYKYVEKELIKYAESFSKLCDYIDKIEDIIPNISLIRYYDESYRKNYAGHCSEIVADFILNGYDIDYLSNKYSMEQKSVNGHSYYVIPK